MRREKGKETVTSDVADGKTVGRRGQGRTKNPFSPARDQDASVSCCGLGCIKWSYSENKGRANGSFLYPKPEK